MISSARHGSNLHAALFHFSPYNFCMLTIKRYANRKLYNTQTRRYVNLDEIAGMIQNGEDVHIVDHQSGADLTAATLLQVILDLEKRIGAFVPNSLLARIIQTSNAAFSQLHEAFGFPHRLSNETIDEEIKRRLVILKEDGMISFKEFENLTGLLTDIRFDQSTDNQQVKANSEDYIPLEELHNLINQVRDLEKKLRLIQFSTDGPD